MAETLDLMWHGDVRAALEAMAPGGAWEERCYTANCPLHHDENWSFSFDLCTRAWHCHSGCGDGDLLALGVRLWCCGVDAAIERIEAVCGSLYQVARRYPYLDQNGEFAFEVLRYSPKAFDCRIPTGWLWKDVYDDGPRMLYRLPEVIRASEVLIVEGERDCETAREVGLVATCNIGGSRAWHDDYIPFFRHKHVQVFPDADDNGRYHARHIAGSLIEVAAAVKMIEFVGVKDLTEWIDAGGTRDTLLALIASTPILSREDTRGWWEPGGPIRLVRAADFLREPQDLRW